MFTQQPLHLTKRQLSMPTLALIVAIVCIVGFVIDILVVGLPPAPSAPQWRLNFLQQVAERGFLLFLGAILLLYSQLGASAKWLRSQSAIYLALGLLLSFSSFLVIGDNLALQREAISNIEIQAAELRTRIVERRNDPIANEVLTPEDFAAALKQVDLQAEQLEQDIETGAVKTLISSAGKLLSIGIALVVLGRLGLIHSFTKRRKYR